MALHHRRDISDIRRAYDSHQSTYSDTGSDKSYLTAPTEVSYSASTRPPPVHHNTSVGHGSQASPLYFDDRLPAESPRSSVESCASTVASEEDVQPPENNAPESREQPCESSAMPSTPSDFSALFPSHRRFQIRHDDSSPDGDMNLRVDTQVSIHGRKCDITLFHLRMHDLQNREFSLRRYCRDSGREVCHSSQKPPQKQGALKRPGFHRSLSNALSGLRPSKSEPRAPTLGSLKRNDSGYDSMHSLGYVDGAQTSPALGAQQHDSVKLEYSNYAQVDVRRMGSKGSKRYEFEYWGVQYAWRRVATQAGGTEDVAFRLTRAGHDKVLAHVEPVQLAPNLAAEARRRGEWIRPCRMWFADAGLAKGQKDVADVIVSSGLIALVDNTIRARSRAPAVQRPNITVSSFGVEYVGPKRFIQEVFRKDTSTSQPSRPSTSSSHSTRPPSAVAGQISY